MFFIGLSYFCFPVPIILIRIGSKLYWFILRYTSAEDVIFLIGVKEILISIDPSDSIMPFIGSIIIYGTYFL